VLTLQEFDELRHLWVKYSIELKHGYTYVNRDGKMVPIDTDAERLRRCRKRVLAVDSALKCLIAEYPAAALRITLMLLPDTTEPE
jgi:hypothetical protein